MTDGKRHTAQAWRTIGGQRKWFRSRWEANVARVMETLRWRGIIRAWEHEPHTFWFEGIRRGANSYKPDFRITDRDGTIYWIEVKGYMDSRSKTCLLRMRKYHPDERVVLIDAKEYRALVKAWAHRIAGWEHDPKPDRSRSKPQKPKLLSRA